MLLLMKWPWLKKNLLAILLFASFSALYIFTAAPGVYDGDSGELAAAVQTLGLAHPTGFPLYILLGKFFTLIAPVGDVAYRLNIFSALLTAAGIAVFFAALRTFGTSRFAALVGSILLGLGRNTIWANSGRVGVYPLSFFLASLLLFIFSLWKRKPKSAYLYAYGFIWGLSLGTHALMILLVIPFLYMLWPVRRFLKENRSALAILLAAIVLPLIQYAYLFFAYRRKTIITWGNMANFHDFLYYITQRQYAGKIFANNFADFFPKLIGLLAGEFIVVFFLAGIIGLLMLSNRRRGVGLPFILLLILNSAVMFAYGKNSDDLKVMFRYLFIADVALAAGSAYILDLFLTRARTSGTRTALIILVLIILGIQGEYSYAANDRHRNFLIQDTAQNALDTLEPNAVLLGLGDHVVGPLWYLQSIGARPDAAVISTALLSFDWYVQNLAAKYPDIVSTDILKFEPGPERIAALIRDNYQKRSVYSIQFNSLQNLTDFDFVPQGILFQIVSARSPAERDMIEYNQTIWNGYVLHNVTPEFYSDQMLKDLTLYYSASLYLAGGEASKIGSIDEAIDFVQKSLDIYPTAEAQSNLAALKKYNQR